MSENRSQAEQMRKSNQRKALGGDTRQTADELIDGPVSPQTNLSSEAEMSDRPNQVKTGESPDFVAVPPYGPEQGYQPNRTNSPGR